MHSRLVLVLLALFIIAPFAADAARPVRFSEAHPQYMAALARALAQEVAADAGQNPADLDEDFSPEDFGLTGVGFLPNSPLYLFKAARRGFTDVFTTNPQAKLEHSLRSASEKLLEAATLSERGASETAVASALDRFKTEVERARARAETASAELNGTEEGAKLARSMMDTVIKYQKLIGKIEKGTSGNMVSSATEAKGRAGEALGAAFGFVPKKDAASTLSEVLDAQQGSEFRDFKNIEVLKTVAENVPEEARAAVRAAEESAITKLESSLDANENGSRAAFGDFLRNVGGNEVRHLAIIQELEVRPLSEGARASLLSAKEEVLSRTEARLDTLSENDKRSFLSHLNEGNIEDVRVVKELEKNVSAESLSDVTDIASSAKENFARKVENAVTDSGERTKLLESVERFHDAKSLSVLDEIAALIPPEQQSIFASLKQKAVSEIQKDISRARNSEQERVLYQALSGDHPEEFTALESFGGISQEVINGIRAATTEQIKARATVIRDEARFGKYEEALRATGAETGIPSGELSAFFSEQRDVYGSREKAEQKIKDAEALVSELSGLSSSLPLNLGYGEDGFDPAIRDAARFLSSAERRIASARAALARNAFGLAYGEAQEAEFAARDGANIARSYKSGRRNIETKSKDSAFTRVGTGGADGEWRLYNKYEFQRFCISAGGALSDALSCEYEDGRVFTVTKEGFPVSVPLAFRPTEKRIVPQPETVVDPEKPLPLPVLDPTKSGRCGGTEKYQCPTGLLCILPEYLPAVVGDYPVYGSCITKEKAEKRPDVTCQAYFEGYIFNGKENICKKQTSSGCSDPFIYKTKEQCDISSNAETKERDKSRWVEHTWKFADGVETSMILNRTDSEYLGYVKNTEIVCRLMPKQQFLWKRGAGNDAADNWKSFGIPDCSGQAFAPANCGNNICESGETVKSCSQDCSGGKTAGDVYSCPGFAYERIDSKGKRYCQLNTKYSCNATYPQFLYESSYAPSLCPNELVTGDANTTATTTTGVQFGNCGANVSSYSCETSRECDWYVPTRGSPYCAPAVRSSWISHTWRFSDGTETSSILSRIDREYSEFIAGVDTQCKTITRSKFAWKQGAGNDAADNWQNFGIPDCSGTATSNTTDGSRTATTTTTTSNPACSDGRDNDGDGQIDYPQDTGCYSAADNDEGIPAGGGGGGSTTCDSALTALLGTGCHQMYTDSSGNTIFCDGPMGKSAKRGDTITTTGCTVPGSGGGTTSGMQKCFYPNASKNGAYVGYTVWCESDYVNCRKGTYTGETISMTGVSLGAPSSCEIGWTGGPSGSCNSNNFCDSWESSATCPADCGSTGGGGGSSGTPAVPTGVTATAPSTGNSVEIRWTDASTNETSFKLWRQVSGSWASLTTMPSSYNAATGGIVTYTDQNVPSGTVNYQIQACNTTGCSSDSNVASAWVAGGGTTTTTPTTTTTTTTTTSAPACSDGRDNDGDGQIDYPQDTGCYSASDPDEIIPSGSGGSSGAPTTCGSALVALLGDGCHQMSTDSSGNTIYCDGPMTKSAKNGDSATTAGCTGSSGGTTSGSSCPSGQYWSGSACVSSSSSSASSCTSGQYWNGTACVSTSPSDTTTSGSTSTYTTCSAGTYWNGTSCVSACSSGQTWNGTSCVSTSGASIWQSFGSWLKGE